MTNKRQNELIVAGATGLVGSAVCRIAVQSGWKVTALVRQPVQKQIENVIYQIIDFNRLIDDFSRAGVPSVVCALGTTMKKAGTKEAFRKVDYDYPLALAAAAKQSDCPHFVLISSVGANADSHFFYSRTKGDVERDLFALKLRQVSVLRPTLLLGPRSEFRPLEQLAGFFSFLTPSSLKPLPAEDVAKAALYLLDKPGRAFSIYEAALIRRMAADY